MTSLQARFQPQEWINDNAVDSAPSVDFDAAPAILKLDLHTLRHVASEVARGGHDIDIVAEHAGLVGSGEGKHDGPYYVDIDEGAWDAFLTEIGVLDVTTISEETWQGIVNMEAATASPTP